MDFNTFKDKAFETAKNMGCDAAELFTEKSSRVDAKVLGGELSAFISSNSKGANLRVVMGLKSGYAYTEEFTNPEDLVKSAIDNATIIDGEDERPMQGATEYADFTKPMCPAKNMGNEELIKNALSLEEYAKNADDRFLRVETCAVSKGVKSVGIYNTLGLAAQYEIDSCDAYVVPILKQGDEVKDAAAWYRNEKFKDLKGCALEGVKKAAQCFDAKSVPSGKYKILVENETAALLLSCFVPVFSAENAQKKLSLLQGKVGEKIAADGVNITDDPFNLTAPRPFDKEGVPSVVTKLVENGVLKTLLHDLKTAKAEGVKSTSNAGRVGTKGSLKVMPTNFYLENGKKTKQELIENMQNGIIINDLGGTHSGVSAVSGDFSLLAGGMLVENGKIVRAVDQITVAGNFFTLLNNIESIANDLHFDYDANGETDASIGSPSFVISELAVSGD